MRVWGWRSEEDVEETGEDGMQQCFFNKKLSRGDVFYQ